MAIRLADLAIPLPQPPESRDIVCSLKIKIPGSLTFNKRLSPAEHLDFDRLHQNHANGGCDHTRFDSRIRNTQKSHPCLAPTPPIIVTIHVLVHAIRLTFFLFIRRGFEACRSLFVMISFLSLTLNNLPNLFSLISRFSMYAGRAYYVLAAS